MGSVCCVAAKEKTIQSESNSEILHRNVRHSPSWSIRWDNRGRVAGEETSVSWYSDRVSRSDGMENKSDMVVETSQPSEVGSPVENFQCLMWAKSPLSEGSSMKKRTSVSDSSISRSVSMEVKPAKELPTKSDKSPVKLSPMTSSIPSLSTSPFHASLSQSRLAHNSPRNLLLRDRSDHRTTGFKSPSNYSISQESLSSPAPPPWSSNGSAGVSHEEFPDFMATPYRERWSFDSELLGFNSDTISRSRGRNSASQSIDLRTCGVCLKLLSEKSSFSSQKMVSNKDLEVVSVLLCGHVYHAECLENMTPEISKYDPACPVCTLGEKKVSKMSEKVLKEEMDLKANKRYKNRVVNGDFNALTSSSSIKSSFGRPFLKRHFSFGSKSSKSFTESKSTRKKGFFWTKSSRE